MSQTTALNLQHRLQGTQRKETVLDMMLAYHMKNEIATDDKNFRCIYFTQDQYSSLDW